MVPGRPCVLESCARLSSSGPACTDSKEGSCTEDSLGNFWSLSLVPPYTKKEHTDFYKENTGSVAAYGRETFFVSVSTTAVVRKVRTIAYQP